MATTWHDEQQAPFAAILPQIVKRTSITEDEQRAGGGLCPAVPPATAAIVSAVPSDVGELASFHKPTLRICGRGYRPLRAAGRERVAKAGSPHCVWQVNALQVLLGERTVWLNVAPA